MDPCRGLKEFYKSWQGKGVIETQEKDATTWLVIESSTSATTVRCERIFKGYAAAFTTRRIVGKDEPGKLQNTLLATGAITVDPINAKAVVPWFIFKTQIALPKPYLQ